MQAEQSILGRIQRRQLKWYGHLLRMEEIVVGRRRFTTGHRTVGEEEEDRNYHGGTSLALYHLRYPGSIDCTGLNLPFDSNAMQALWSVTLSVTI